MDDLVHLRPTVKSLSELMSEYLEICVRCSSLSQVKVDELLSSFPVVQPFDTKMVFRSQTDVVSAIDCQSWSLLASRPIENIPIRNNEFEDTGSKHPLVAAIISGEGRPFLLRRLLKVFENPNFIDPYSKWPLLMIAVFYGRIQAVQVLIELGAYPNTSILVKGKRVTALGMAITNGNTDMVSFLILSGANPYKVCV